MTIRKYEVKDLQQMIDIWNEVVEDGIVHMAPCFGRFCGAKRLRCVASGQYYFFYLILCYSS